MADVVVNEAQSILEEIVLEDEASAAESGSGVLAVGRDFEVGGSNNGAGVENKRQHQRFRVSLKVYIRLSNGEIAHARAIDLSMGGIYIEYGAPADENKVFDMAFDLPFATDFHRIFVRAKVVRSIVIGSRNVFGLAFAFSAFSKGTDKVLESYLEMRGMQV